MKRFSRIRIKQIVRMLKDRFAKIRDMLTLSWAQIEPDRRSYIIDAFNLQCKTGVVRLDVGVSPIYNTNKSRRGGRQATKKS